MMPTKKLSDMHDFFKVDFVASSVDQDRIRLYQKKLAPA
jgi:hypothetical protein